MESSELFNAVPMPLFHGHKTAASKLRSAPHRRAARRGKAGVGRLKAAEDGMNEQDPAVDAGTPASKLPLPGMMNSDEDSPQTSDLYAKMMNAASCTQKNITDDEKRFFESFVSSRLGSALVN